MFILLQLIIKSNVTTDANILVVKDPNVEINTFFFHPSFREL